MGLIVLPAESKKTRKIGVSVCWNLDEDNKTKQKLVIKEFITELKEAITVQAREANHVVPGSINVFNDDSMHKQKKRGIYGWVEVY